MKNIISTLFISLMANLVYSQNECSPNDAFTQACSITLTNLTGQINGSINPNNDVDFYYFVISRPCVINYSVTNVPANIAIRTELYPESNTSTYLYSAQAATGAGVNGVKKVCSAGKYYIKIYDNHGSGTYQSPDLYNLKITLDTSDVYECNESFIACTPISLNKDIKGAINSDGDFDFYCFNVPRSGVINYSVTNVSANIAIRTELYHESNQSTYLYSAQAVTGAGVSGVKKVCSAGKYYIKINDNHGSGINQSPDLYTLKITLDTSDVYECNESFIACTPISLNKDIKGSIDSDGDIDFYCFNVPRSGVISYSITNVPSNIAIRSELYHESNQSTYVYSAQAVTGSTVNGVKKVCSTGKYYIKINDNHGSGTSQSPILYNFKVTLDTSDIYECNDDFLTASTISCNAQISASINTEDDNDCFKVTLTRPDTITVNVTNVPSNLDISIRLYGPSPSTSQIGSTVNGSTGASVSLKSPTKLQIGAYYVCLTDNKANANPYRLTVVCPSMVGIEEHGLEPNFTIYPNPSNEKLTIELSNTEGILHSLKITDLTGKPLATHLIHNRQAALNIADLPKGLYLLMVETTDGRRGVQKFVKN